MNITRTVALALFAGAVVFSGGPAQEKKTDLVIVKYDGLKREVQKHRGKVVVVDFWASY